MYIREYFIIFINFIFFCNLLKTQSFGYFGQKTAHKPSININVKAAATVSCLKKCKTTTIHKLEENKKKIM